MMHMTFYWGKTVTILFDTWKTTTWTGYLLSLLALLVVSAFYEYLESFRIRVKLLSRSIPASESIEAPLRIRGAGKAGTWAAPRFATAAIFGVNSAIGYLLMLAVMSFNGGVFVSVVLGLAIGYLAFRSRSEEDAVSNALVELSTSNDDHIVDQYRRPHRTDDFLDRDSQRFADCERLHDADSKLNFVI